MIPRDAQRRTGQAAGEQSKDERRWFRPAWRHWQLVRDELADREDCQGISRDGRGQKRKARVVQANPFQPRAPTHGRRRGYRTQAGDQPDAKY